MNSNNNDTHRYIIHDFTAYWSNFICENGPDQLALNTSVGNTYISFRSHLYKIQEPSISDLGTLSVNQAQEQSKVDSGTVQQSQGQFQSYPRTILIIFRETSVTDSGTIFIRHRVRSRNNIHQTPPTPDEEKISIRFRNPLQVRLGKNPHQNHLYQIQNQALSVRGTLYTGQVYLTYSPSYNTLMYSWICRVGGAYRHQYSK